MANPISKWSMPGSSWTDAKCGSCHQMTADFSHPVGMIPSSPIPSSLPLDNGRFTCTTCHLDDSAAHALARKNHTQLLRSELTGGNGCNVCHDQHGQLTRSAQHSAINVAHLTWAKDDPSRLDLGRSITRQCLTCHDGMLSTDVPTGGRIQVAGMGGPSHPVGMAYRSGAIRQADNVRIQMVPAYSLDQRIHLFGGEVQCVTCHSPYSSQDKLLVMSNFRSALCLSCHRE